MSKTYGVLAHIGDSWVLNGLDPHVVIKLKAVFPSIPAAARAPFRFVDNPERAADLTWFQERYPFGMSADDRALLAQRKAGYEQVMAELERITADDYAPPEFAGVRAGWEIRPHQARAAAVLQRMGGLLVGDDVGEGKTYSTGACCLLPGALPALVVVQPHLKTQWVKKLTEFTTLSVAALEGTRPYAPPPVDVRVIGYTQLAGWNDLLCRLGVGLIAFDEVHELRNGDGAQKGAAAKNLAAAARYRLGLSATPVLNYGDEMWRVMQYLRPDLLGAFDEFVFEYCRGLSNGKWIVENPKALGTYLRDQHAMVRKVKDRRNKPNIVVQEVDYDAGALDDIEAMAVALAQRATSGSFTERGEATRQLDMLARQATGVSKAPYVAKVVRVLVEAGEPVILYGWHREVYDIWLRELADLKPAMYTGTESPKEKDRSKARFMSGDTDIIILSLRAGVGLDGLQHRCSTVVFGELDWTSGVHHQCIGRIDREGQLCYPEPVQALYLVVEDGSDPALMQMQGLKASQGAGIVDPHLGVQTATGDVTRMKALVERYLTAKDRRGGVAKVAS